MKPLQMCEWPIALDLPEHTVVNLLDSSDIPRVGTYAVENETCAH